MKFTRNYKLVAFGILSLVTLASATTALSHMTSAKADMSSVNAGKTIKQSVALEDTLADKNRKLRADMQKKRKEYEFKALEKKQAAERVAKAEQAKAEQAKAEQAKAEQAAAEQANAEQAAAEQAAAEQAAAEQTTVEQAAAPATQNVQAAQASTNEPSYYVGGYTSASSSDVQAVIDSDITLWASISDIPTSGGVALFGHTDFAGRASAGGWIAGASVGQIVNIGGANYRITSKYTVINNSDAQYDAVTGAQPGEVIFHTCATLDQGTVWVLRTQRI